MSIELNGTTGIDFNDGSNQSTAATPYGRKNLIINGDMRIAQRGTSSSSYSTSGYPTIDRFQVNVSALGVYTVSQNTDVPTGQGFVSSLKMLCTTADASPASTDYLTIVQKIEAQNLQHLKFGTSNAESLTLSFWVKSNKTGTYVLMMYIPDSGRLLSKTYTIDSADTWEKKTITVDGDTTGSINNDNGDGINLYWHLADGSNRTSGTPNTDWGAYSTSNEAAGQTVNLSDATSNYFNITGVQLEVGTATPFEHRPYDMELARCQRYYEHNYNIGQTPGSVSTYPGGMGAWLNGFGTHSGQKGFQSDYKVTKRATPSVTFYDTDGNSAKASTLNAGGTTTTNQPIAIVMTGTSSILGTAGDGSHTGVHYFWVADSEL